MDEPEHEDAEHIPDLGQGDVPPELLGAWRARFTARMSRDVLEKVVTDLERDRILRVDPDEWMTTRDEEGDIDNWFTLREIVEAVLRNLD